MTNSFSFRDKCEIVTQKEGNRFVGISFNGKNVKSIKVKLSNIDKYNIKASSDITKYLPSDYNKDRFKIKYDGDETLTFLSRKGRNLGTVKYYYDGKLLYKEDAILKQNIKINIIKVTKSYWYIILLICIIVIYNLSKKSRKRSL